MKNVKLGEHNSKLRDIELLLSLFSVSGVCSGSFRCPCFLGDGTAMGQFSQGLWAGGLCGRDEDSQCSLPGQTLGHTAIHTPPSRAERFVTKSVSLSRETSGLASQLFPTQELQVAGSRCQLTRGPQKQQREVNI